GRMSPRRILALVLPRLRLEIARTEDPRAMDGGGVMAVVIARQASLGTTGRGKGGAVKEEHSLLGNTRLDEVSSEAFALRVRPGHTIAAARARAAGLRVRVVPEHVTQRTLARLCEALLAFGRATSFSASESAIWVDVTGCAHLFGGEERLSRAVHARVTSFG